ncbi:MAG: sel1 repeat family protein [Candidatus Caenarcaniphilales bacterium]|nr:sel1 repeat family protein [Candidatus Caenarcaniphilales bacterium]
MASKILRIILLTGFLLNISLTSHAYTSFKRSHCYKIYKKKLYENLLSCTEKYARSGDPMAEYFMGKIYYEGLETPRNYKKAYEWYFKAAEQSYAEAENKLGQMLDEGKGVVQNYARAYYWYTRSALKDYAHAQFNLADMLSAGRGLDRNIEQAYIWALIAASNEHKDAIRIRDTLEINFKSAQLIKLQNQAQTLDTDIKSGEAIKRFMAEEKAKELARLAAEAAKKKKEAAALAKKMKKKPAKK